MRPVLTLLLTWMGLAAFSQQKPARNSSSDTLFPFTRFDTSRGQETPTYEEIIRFWKEADAVSTQIKMIEMGPSDAGFPLHLVLVSADGDFDIRSIKAKNKCIILINNGIHPGEPDGIDASMRLVRDYVSLAGARHLPKGSLTSGGPKNLPKNVVLAIVPVYNIGGVLNRSTLYRVDQNGPEAFGFRGNSENLDLNRDFIKNDSKESLTFARIFHYLDPDVFIDNHVSNGADYQHVMTLLTSQHNKLGGDLGTFLNREFEPALYRAMKTRGYDLVPYVNHFGDATPDQGWPEFWDSPRYSSGYTTLWNTFSFVPETHMLKPYDQRVDATYQLMACFIDFVSAHSAEIRKLRGQAFEAQRLQESFPLAWKLDRSRNTTITFKGYESGHKTSEVSGLPRLYYDPNKPYEKQIPFWNEYRDTLSVSRPKAYLIPQGWWKVIERLQANGVKMRRLAHDSTVNVESYHIDSYQSSPRPFEGHHLNSGVRVTATKKQVSFRKGDYYIPLDQPANRFLIETLEPQGEDSYFAWNFFDPILGQKEGYSDYHFEDVAAGYLREHPELRARLEARKAQDSSFSQNAGAQLNFVYQNSPWFEPAYLNYPVYRVL